MDNTENVTAHASKEKQKCGAHARRTGKPCRNPAGFRTDHPGQGRCYLHGGCNPIKHGRYSKVLRGPLKERYERHKTDPDILNLRSELALLRANLEEWLDRTQDEVEWKFEDSVDTSTKLVKEISKVIERIHKIEVGEKYVIDIRGVERAMEYIVEVINRHVSDPATRNKIAKDLARLHL